MKKQTKKASKAQEKKVKSVETQVINKVIFAEKASKLWKVYILDLNSSSQESVFFFRTPLKAIRYSFMLKSKSGLRISEKALRFLTSEHKANKQQ